MRILGTKFWGHDSALYYLDTDAKEIFALSTERITRIKHDRIDVTVALNQFPAIRPDIVVHSYGTFGDNSLDEENRKDGVIFLLQEKIARDFISSSHLPKEHMPQRFVQSHKLYHEIHRIMELDGGEFIGMPDNGSMHRSAVEHTFKLLLASSGYSVPLQFANHHLCHAASAYFTSPYCADGKAAVVTFDGWGDHCFGKAFIFSANGYIELGKSPALSFSHNGRTHVMSVGELYAVFTEALGFRKYSDEGKVEALAAFGTPDSKMLEQLNAATQIRDNAIYLDPRKLAQYYDPTFIRSVSERIGIENCSATIQTFLEETIVRYLNALTLPNDIESICLSGGVFANVIINLKIFERCRFGSRMYITPFMADEGTACGAAILTAVKHGKNVSWIKEWKMPYLGPEYDRTTVTEALENIAEKVTYEFLGEDWPYDAAKSIHANKVIGVFQGRMEFGPRALGNRSILADPRDRQTREKINLSIKRRPVWQPLCPSVLESERERLFEASFSHKHMAIAFRLKREFFDALPSAIHVDGTARPQFVSKEDNPSYFTLLTRVKELSGFGVVINTSFNIHGRAIVMTPTDALTDFLDCNLDVLYIAGYRVERKQTRFDR